MKMRCRHILLLLGLLWAVPAIGGTIPYGYDYADYAAFAATETFAPVGLVRFSGGYGSGVYIGDGWVVTAAHVAAETSPFTFTLDGQVYQGDPSVVPDGWNGDTSQGNDIGLIHLTGALPDVAPASFYTGDNADLLGEVLALSGYGKTGDGVSGATGTGGHLYAGTNTADVLGGSRPVFSGYDERIVLMDFDNPYVSDDGYIWSQGDAGPLEFMVAPGDSGGGVFLIGGTESLLVGVNAFVLGLDGLANSDYGDALGVTTVSPHIDWIEAVTQLLLRDYAPGDATRDGFVNDDDLSILLTRWKDRGEGISWNTGDFDDNGVVNDDDLSLLLSNWTGPLAAVGGPVPEPGALPILAVAGAVLLARRKRRQAPCAQ